MKFLEKLAFIQGKLHLNDYAFCTRFRIKISVLKKWKRGQLSPTADDIKWVCNYFHLDANDFLDDSSTLAKVAKDGEHVCATKTVPENHKVTVSAWLTEGVTYAPVIAVKAEKKTFCTSF